MFDEVRSVGDNNTVWFLDASCYMGLCYLMFILSILIYSPDL